MLDATRSKFEKLVQPCVFFWRLPRLPYRSSTNKVCLRPALDCADKQENKQRHRIARNRVSADTDKNNEPRAGQKVTSSPIESAVKFARNAIIPNTSPFRQSAQFDPTPQRAGLKGLWLKVLKTWRGQVLNAKDQGVLLLDHRLGNPAGLMERLTNLAVYRVIAPTLQTSLIYPIPILIMIYFSFCAY